MVRNYKRKTEDRWSKEDLLEALICIKEAKLKINDAARQYGISRATLYRQYQKFILAGGKCDVNQFRTCGGNPILTKVEEDVLEKTIRDLREQGFTVTSSDIKRICFEYCDSNGIPNQFNQEKRMASDDWYYGFLKRHPDVRIPKSATSQTSSNRPSSGTSSSGELEALLASTPTPDKPTIKTKKLKSSPTKKLLKPGSPSKSPVHIIPTISNNVTVVNNDEQLFQQQFDNLISNPNKGKKQHLHASNHIPSGGHAAALKKSLKRLTSNVKSRGRKSNNPSAATHTIPIDDEFVKAEADEEVEDDGDEQGIGEIEMEQDEAMETEDVEEEEEDEEEEEEEEDDDEDEEEAGDEQAVENVEDGEEEETEDVEMVEEDEEEQDEVEKSESEEEEEGDEEEAEAEDEEDVEEAEDVDEQEEVDEDAENDAEEGEAEEGEEDDDEEEDEDEEEEEEDNENDDEDENGDDGTAKADNDGSGSDVDCTNDDDELLEKLLDM